jgi:hypothetical protein
MFLDARKKQRRAGTVQAPIQCSEGTGRTSLSVLLVNKPPKEHLDVRKPVIWGTSAFSDAPDNVTGRSCR